jgi:hypothetical protein
MALAAKFQRSELSPQLTWSHYCALLPFDAETARSLAKKAEEKELAVKALKVEIVKARERKYSERPARFLGVRLGTLLNPLSGIPDPGVFESLEGRDIEGPTLRRLEKRVEAAEEKMAGIRKFLSGLKAVEAPEDGAAPAKGPATKKPAKRHYTDFPNFSRRLEKLGKRRRTGRRTARLSPPAAAPRAAQAPSEVPENGPVPLVLPGAHGALGGELIVRQDGSSFTGLPDVELS